MKKSRVVVVLLLFATVCHAQSSHTASAAEDISFSSSDSVKISLTAVPHKAAALLKGDVNGDNIVNLLDVVDLSRYLCGKARSAFNKTYADINSDGKINSDDLRALSTQIVEDRPMMSGEEVAPLRGDSNGSPQW